MGCYECPTIFGGPEIRSTSGTGPGFVRSADLKICSISAAGEGGPTGRDGTDGHLVLSEFVSQQSRGEAAFAGGQGD